MPRSVALRVVHLWRVRLRRDWIVAVHILAVVVLSIDTRVPRPRLRGSDLRQHLLRYVVG